VVLPRNCLVGLGELDPCAAAPLADAGATSYHAVEVSRPFLRPGSAAVVIGAGGLGGYAIQFLRLAGTAPIVAVDVSSRRLADARDLGADATVDGTADPSDVVDEVVRAGGGAAGAAVVFDFVASEATLATATRLASPGGAVVIVGSGHGAVSVGWGRTPPECHVFTCLGNTLCDLRDVLSLARAGQIRLPHRRIAFSEVAEGYQQIVSGEADGRIVVGMSRSRGGT
jgi:propanol-preferring alcohol dehydrogenase